MAENRYALLRDLTERASVRALDWFDRRATLAAETKPGNQFVSEADRDVERLIRNGIHVAFPQDEIIGEEMGGAAGSGFTWHVDPIDGTSNFLNGLPFWGVCIGIADQTGPVLGAIALPALGLALIGGPEHPLSDLDGEKISHRAPPVPTIAMGWNTSLPLEREAAQIAAVRALGYETVVYRCACVSLAYSAIGLISGFFETRTSSWDIAAGWALNLAAGLDVEGCLHGEPGTQSIATGEVAHLLNPAPSLHQF